jgi:hypothetical protein
MLKALLHAMIRSRLERPFGYDAGYMHLMIDTSPMAAIRFSVVSGMVPRRDAPAEGLAAVGIVGAVAEDCGPCTQIGVDMAIAGGARPAVVRAILVGDEAAMGEDALLGYRFARAVLGKSLDEADRCRDEVVRRWGEKGLVALSLALTAARMYPTLKYALGYGKTCLKVMVQGKPTSFARPERLAA